MAGPTKVTQEEYDKIRSRMEEKYHYDDMSDEDKERFDSEMDKSLVVDDKADETDEGDTTDDEELEKGEFEDGHPHEHDDEENVR